MDSAQRNKCMCIYFSEVLNRAHRAGFPKENICKFDSMGKTMLHYYYPRTIQTYCEILDIRSVNPLGKDSFSGRTKQRIGSMRKQINEPGLQWLFSIYI